MPTFVLWILEKSPTGDFFCFRLRGGKALKNYIQKGGIERMSEAKVAANVFDALKGLDLPEGKFAVGEYRGYDERESGGKMYYKLKLLVRDSVLKFDIKPDQVIALNQSGIKVGLKTMVQYYDFQGKFGTNSVLTSYVSL